jgi:hypothetical protein
MTRQLNIIPASARALRRGCAADSSSREAWIALVLAASIPLLLAFFASCASAEGLEIVPPTQIDETLVEPKLLPGAFAGAFTGAPTIYGTSRAVTRRLRATYGIGDADDTALSSAFLRLEEFRHRDEMEDRSSRDNWRHFLGVEYEPIHSFSLLGGIAKSSGVNGNKGIALAPTGYERLRLNTGARWRGDDFGFDGWGVDGSFSFIPTGATRVPGDAGFMPGMGDSGPTWLFSLTVSRRF